MTVFAALAGFLLAAGLLVLTPGLDIALVLRTLAVEGPCQAMAAATGVVVGVLAWGLMVAPGMVRPRPAFRRAPSREGQCRSSPPDDRQRLRDIPGKIPMRGTIVHPEI